VTSGVIPEPRARHVACAVGDQYLLVFGGGSTARCRGGLALLDTRTGEWATPQCEGAMPAARSGAAAALLGGCWYISGGGDHKRAMTDTLVLEARAPAPHTHQPLPLKTDRARTAHSASKTLLRRWLRRAGCQLGGWCASK
jgi:hypothetical protein